MPRCVSGGLAGNTSRCQRRQKLLPDGDKVDVDLHTDTNNFALNEYRGVVNLSGLAVYKGSNTRDNDIGDCN